MSSNEAAMSGRVVLLSTSEELAECMRDVLEPFDLALLFADPAEFDTLADEPETLIAGHMLTLRPDVIVISHDVGDELRSTVTGIIDAASPDTVTIWLGGEDPDIVWSALRVGARDVIPVTVEDNDVAERLSQAAEMSIQRRARSGASLIDELGIELPEPGRIITVVSPKGGTGKTMLSSNLAVSLQSQERGSVALIDLDLQFGDIAVAMGQRSPYDVSDVVHSRPDTGGVKAFLDPHPSGVYTLSAPTNPIEAEDITPDAIGKMLFNLAEEFDFVIVDTGAGINDTMLAAVEASTDIVFLTTVDVTSLDAMRKTVVLFDRLSLQDHRRFFILNRASSRTGLLRTEIENVTGISIDSEIPSHRSVSKAMNDGKLLVDVEARGKPAKALGEVAASIADAAPAPVNRKGKQ